MLDPILHKEKNPQASKTEIEILLCSIVRAILFHFSVEGQDKTELKREQTCVYSEMETLNAFYPPCPRHIPIWVQGRGLTLPRDP